MAAAAASAVVGLATPGSGAGVPTAAAAGLVERPLFLSVSDASETEADGAGVRVLRFRVSIARQATHDVTATLATRNGTATATADYVPRQATVTIPAGSTTAMFLVTVRNDNEPEYALPAAGAGFFGDFSLFENMQVRVLDATGAAILDGTGVGRIEEDDRAFDSFVAAATGHSYANAYLLALASHDVYHEELGASEAGFEDAYRTRFAKLGMETVDVVTRTAPVVDLQAAVMQNASALVIAFRGTKEPTDFLTDALFALLPISALESVHAGFWLSIESAYTELRQHAEAAGSRRIWLTGHSLGGALATVLAYRLQRDGIRVQGVYTYGSPRVGSSTFALSYGLLFADRPTQRWVDVNDPVALVPTPAMGYAHVGRYNHIVPVPFTTQFVANLNVIVELPVVGDVTLGDHNTRRYLNRILANAPASVRSRMPAPPPPN